MRRLPEMTIEWYQEQSCSPRRAAWEAKAASLPVQVPMAKPEAPSASTLMPAENPEPQPPSAATLMPMEASAAARRLPEQTWMDHPVCGARPDRIGAHRDEARRMSALTGAAESRPARHLLMEEPSAYLSWDQATSRDFLV